MPNENSRTYRLVKVLNSLTGCRAKKRHGGKFQSGDPDVAGVYYGHAFFIEVKVAAGALTPLQAEELNKWKAAGGITAVAVYHDPERTKLGPKVEYTSGRGGAFRVYTLNPSENWDHMVGSAKNKMGGEQLSFDEADWSAWLNTQINLKR